MRISFLNVHSISCKYDYLTVLCYQGMDGSEEHFRENSQGDILRKRSGLEWVTGEGPKIR